MLVVVSRPQTDPSAGALGGLDDHRKHARAREHAEKRGRARTRCCQAQGVTRRPHFRPRTRGLRTRPHDSLHSRVRGSRSHKSRAWRQPKRPSPVRDARAAHGSWRRRGKRKRWSWRGETAVTPLAREVRSPRAPGEGHVPGRVVTVSCKRVTCPRGNHLTGELLSVLLRVARSRHPPCPNQPHTWPLRSVQTPDPGRRLPGQPRRRTSSWGPCPASHLPGTFSPSRDICSPTGHHQPS